MWDASKSLTGHEWLATKCEIEAFCSQHSLLAKPVYSGRHGNSICLGDITDRWLLFCGRATMWYLLFSGRTLVSMHALCVPPSPAPMWGWRHSDRAPLTSRWTHSSKTFWPTTRRVCMVIRREWLGVKVQVHSDQWDCRTTICHLLETSQLKASQVKSVLKLLCWCLSHCSKGPPWYRLLTLKNIFLWLLSASLMLLWQHLL